MLRAVPLILIAVAAYNALVFGGAAMGHDAVSLLSQSFAVPVFSGDSWKNSLGDGVVALTLILLFIETVKATRTDRRQIINHALSMLTFTGALTEFIALKGFATSTFFLITAMCLFDVVAGYTISIIAAKRDLNVAPPHDP
jgi:hypothetical protein